MTGRLSTAVGSLADSYDVVVVGSGYGGSIAACRLARTGRRVCVLERGEEWQPGSYPQDQLAVLEELQVDSSLGHVGSRTALFDVRSNKDINVIVGCGLGGTSLINAGICLRPSAEVTNTGSWPYMLRAPGVLDPYFDLAEQMLRPSIAPSWALRSHKTEALRAAAQKLGKDITPVPVLITFEKPAGGLNHAGVPQQACVGCGNCISGCNYAAKNTLIMNYLPDAKNHSAEIFTCTKVTSVREAGGGWQVVGHTLDEKGRERPLAIRAQVVILAAGTLGSTEILLRSAEAGLSVSSRIGTRFSGNGDTIGFAYNTDHQVNGQGERAGSVRRSRTGPCSTAIIDLRNGDPSRGQVMADGTVPGALAGLLSPALALQSHLTGIAPRADLWRRLRRYLREVQSGVLGPYRGATRNTLFFLLMTHDASTGRMHLQDDRLRVEWPGVGQQPQFKAGSELLKRASHALGGTYIPNPVWNELTHHDLVTGHPLGGCPMADNAEQGVVNHKSQLFRSDSGRAVHAGLYVMDGSVVPTALGVNPLLTISALAERSCHHLILDLGWESVVSATGQRDR